MWKRLLFNSNRRGYFLGIFLSHHLVTLLGILTFQQDEWSIQAPASTPATVYDPASGLSGCLGTAPHPEIKQRRIVIQCDQMARLFFNIWPFATMKTCPIMSQICQSRLSIMPIRKWTVKNLPKIWKVLHYFLCHRHHH